MFSEVFSLCTKLIRKDVFERFGRLPELRIGEDACFLYSVLSYLDGRIDYFEQPYYYYELSENSVSQSNTEFEVVEDILKGNSILLERCNPEYLNVLKCIVIRRTRNMMFRYEEYKDMFVQYLKEHKDLYEYNLFLKEKMSGFVSAVGETAGGKRGRDSTYCLYTRIWETTGSGIYEEFKRRTFQNGNRTYCTK